MQEYRRALISSIAIGIGLGFLLGTFFLFLLLKTSFSISSFGFVLEVVIACSIPFCVFVVRKFGLSYPIISLFMLTISFVIITISGNIISQSSKQLLEESTLFQEIMLINFILHALMLAITFVIYWLYRKDLMKDESSS